MGESPAIRAGFGAVPLLDELDRADDEFEALLFEVHVGVRGDDPGDRSRGRRDAARRRGHVRSHQMRLTERGVSAPPIPVVAPNPTGP